MTNAHWVCAVIFVDHDLVKIAISKDTKFAKWVAYKVEYKNLNGSF